MKMYECLNIEKSTVMKNKINFLIVCMTMSILYGCSKDPLRNLSDDESRIYITNYDSTTNFRNYKTFSISDSVAVISDGMLQKKSISETDSAIINAVKENMQQRGYELVNKSDNPDLGVSVN